MVPSEGQTGRSLIRKNPGNTNASYRAATSRILTNAATENRLNVVYTDANRAAGTGNCSQRSEISPLIRSSVDRLS